MMVSSVDRAYKPFSGAATEAPGSQASQKAFRAALQKADPPSPPPQFQGAATEADLIETLRTNVEQSDPARDGNLLEMQLFRAVDYVKPFLDRQPKEQQQEIVLRLMQAFQKPADKPETARTDWVLSGIDIAAALSGLTTDPAEAERRKGEETFAASIYQRGNTLMYQPENSGGDNQQKIEADIRAYLEEVTARFLPQTKDRHLRGYQADSQPPDTDRYKKLVLNRLYEREWTDAAPVQAAIETIAKEDFPSSNPQEPTLKPTLHQGAGTHDAARAMFSQIIRGRDLSSEKEPSKLAAERGDHLAQTRGYPDYQSHALTTSARYASPAVQREVTEAVSGSGGLSPFEYASDYVMQPLSFKGRSPQDKGLDIFSRLEWITRDMKEPLAAETVKQVLREANWHADAREFDFKDLKGKTADDLRNLREVIKRVKGTAAGDWAINWMREHRIPVDDKDLT